MGNDVTQTFARFASQLSYDAIPPSAREYTRHLLLDALACALAGYGGEDTAKVIRFASALGQSQESSIIGGGRLSLAGATMLNGFLITAISMCDVYRPTATHLQPVIVSPAQTDAGRILREVLEGVVGHPQYKPRRSGVCVIRRLVVRPYVFRRLSSTSTQVRDTP